MSSFLFKVAFDIKMVWGEEKQMEKEEHKDYSQETQVFQTFTIAVLNDHFGYLDAVMTLLFMSKEVKQAGRLCEVKVRTMD